MIFLFSQNFPGKLHIKPQINELMMKAHGIRAQRDMCFSAEQLRSTDWIYTFLYKVSICIYDCQKRFQIEYST